MGLIESAMKSSVSPSVSGLASDQHVKHARFTDELTTPHVMTASPIPGLDQLSSILAKSHTENSVKVTMPPRRPMTSLVDYDGDEMDNMTNSIFM